MAKFNIIIVCLLFLTFIITQSSSQQFEIVGKDIDRDYENLTQIEKDNIKYNPVHNCGIHTHINIREGKFYEAIGYPYGRPELKHKRRIKKPKCRSKAKKVDRDAVDKIAGGYPLEKGQFPSYVRLRVFLDDRVMVCGGTLLGRKYILTAAQCVVNKTVDGDFIEHNDILVKTGSVLREHQYTAKAEKVCYIKSYNGFMPLVNDIAVIRVDRLLNFNENQLSACLPMDDIADTERLYAVGMGITERQKLSNKLKYIPVRQGPCFDESNFYETLCLREDVPYGNGGNICRGDVGGPIMADRNGRHVVVGVISYGYGCDTHEFNAMRATSVFKLRKALTGLMKECA